MLSDFSAKSRICLCGKIAFIAVVLFGATGFNTVDRSNKDAAADYYVQNGKLPPRAGMAFLVQFFIAECNGQFRLKKHPSDLYRAGAQELKLMRPKIRVVEAKWREHFMPKRERMCGEWKSKLESGGSHSDMELRRR